MFWFPSLRVNDKSQFTFDSMTGEFGLYVNPEGPKQNWRLPRSIRAKP